MSSIDLKILQTKRKDEDELRAPKVSNPTPRDHFLFDVWAWSQRILYLSKRKLSAVSLMTAVLSGINANFL
jgi:hypothetical protein